ncbi:MAG: DMT family transporter [Hyphomicrobiales bacterium]|nr:DMT family transporter [Hyphomicrobiales bacterium]
MASAPGPAAIASRCDMSGAFALAVTSVGLLSGMDALVKAQAAQFPVAQIACLRFVFGSLAILIAIAIARPARPRLETVIANSWRAVLGVSTSITFYFALGRLPLAETLALSLLSPCTTVLFSMLILRETVSRSLIIALGVGFLGMLLIIAPNFGHGHASVAALEGTLAVLISTLTYSLSLVLLRSRATRDHPLIIVAVQNIGPMLILSAVIPLWPAGLWVPVQAFDLLNFAGIGTLGVCGHLVLAKAFSLAPAGRMAPADYTTLVFGSVYGYLFFGEIPAWTTIAGGLLIIVSSFTATRR